MISDQTPVTVIGLGLMGQALAARFLREGHPTTVWNRTAAKAEPLVAEGATLAGSPAEAIAASPLVVVCVTDYDAVRELLDPVAEIPGGTVVVNLTSGTSAQARGVAERVARRGGEYLDGGVMATPEGVGTGEATLVYSGPRAVFERHEPALRTLGAAVRLGDDHGLSALHEVAVLSLMWNMLNGFLHGAAVLRAAGVDVAAAVPLVDKGISTITSWLPAYARQVDEGAYPVLDATLDTQMVAMGHVVHESEALGVDAALPRSVLALAERAAAAGHGGHSYAAVVEQFTRPGSATP